MLDFSEETYRGKTMKKILLVLQCCKRKSDIELYPNESFDLTSKIPRTKKILEDAIKRFSRERIIDTTSKPITALSRYNGHFYNTPGLKMRITDEIKHGPYQFLIISAAYGLVHPFTKIHNYEQQMKGKITRYWINIGLPKVLEEFIENGKYKKVYGFFSKSADYKKIFEEVNWHRIKELKEAGYFYLDGIRGINKTLKLSAILMLKLIDKNFKEKPHSIKDAEVVLVKTI